MSTSWQHGKRGLAMTAVVGVLLAGCGQGQGQDEQAQDEQAQDEQAQDEQAQDEQAQDEQAAGEEPDGEALDEQTLEDMTGGAEDMEDPNEDVEDGVYRGNGVTLPVPEGWSLDPAAFQQGIVAATSEDGEQQLTARAIDAEQAEAAGQPMDLDTLLDTVREQVEEDPATDEEVDVAEADRAHRLTFLDLPAQQEGQPDSSATLVLASGDDVVGEFAYSAVAEGYDEDLASLLVDEAGFDPDSEPPQAPGPAQPVPEDEGAETDQGGETEEPPDAQG